MTFKGLLQMFKIKYGESARAKANHIRHCQRLEHAFKARNWFTPSLPARRKGHR